MFINTVKHDGRERCKLKELLITLGKISCFVIFFLSCPAKLMCTFVVVFLIKLEQYFQRITLFFLTVIRTSYFRAEAESSYFLAI